MALTGSAERWLQTLIQRFAKSKNKRDARDSYDAVFAFGEEHGIGSKKLRASATKKEIISAGVALAKQILAQKARECLAFALRDVDLLSYTCYDSADCPISINSPQVGHACSAVNA